LLHGIHNGSVIRGSAAAEVLFTELI